MSLGVDIWGSIMVRYTVPTISTIYLDERRAYVNNAKSRNYF